MNIQIIPGETSLGFLCTTTTEQENIQARDGTLLLNSYIGLLANTCKVNKNVESGGAQVIYMIEVDLKNDDERNAAAALLTQRKDLCQQVKEIVAGLSKEPRGQETAALYGKLLGEVVVVPPTRPSFTSKHPSNTNSNNNPVLPPPSPKN